MLFLDSNEWRSKKSQQSGILFKCAPIDERTTPHNAEYKEYILIIQKLIDFVHDLLFVNRHNNAN